MKKNKILFSSISLIIVVLIASSYLLWKQVDTKEKEELAYQLKLAETLNLIDSSKTDSAVVAGTFQKYWGKIIESSISFATLSDDLHIPVFTIESLVNTSERVSYTYAPSLAEGEFDTVLNIVKNAKSGDINSVLKQHQIVTNSIKELKNPPINFKDSYEILLECYEVYDTFVSLSTSPNGSYIEYSRNINSTYETLSSKVNTALLQLP